MLGRSLLGGEARRLALLQAYCKFSAVLTTIMGTLILSGWEFHLEPLKTIIPGGAEINPNAALLLVFAGISLQLLLSGKAAGLTRHVAGCLAVLVTLLGAATRMEYFFHSDWRVDHLFFAALPSDAVSPWRMAPTSAASFIAIGLALLMLEWETKRGRRISQGLSLWPSLIALLGMTSYVYQATSVNRLWLYTQIPMPMAVALFLLSGGIFFARPGAGIAGDLVGEGSGSALARRLLPAVFFIPLLLGWICLWGERAGFYGPALGLAAYSASSVVVFGALVWLSTRNLNVESAQRNAAENEIRALNADLEARVAERTNALAQQKFKLQSLTERLSLATSVAKVGVWDWDLASNLLTWDETMFEIYGVPPAAAMPYEKWASAIHPDDLPLFESTSRKVIQEKSEGFAEFRMTRTDGAVRHISLAQRVLLDEHGQVSRVIGANMDVTEHKETEEALRKSEARLTHSAQHDFLTGLPNRMLLNDRVNQAIIFASRVDKKVGVLFLDLDGFKHINDSLGHPIGDKLLQSIAERLMKCVRATDTVSRQGGDEFVILLSEMAHSEDAAITARRILQALAQSHVVDQHELHITASMGISVHPEDGLDAETLIKNADTAMYQSKENGRQTYQFFKPAMNVRAVARQSMEESLRRALERQEFSVVYQPKVNLKTSEITGSEALLRWTHPTRGPISPAKFIPVAEDSGLILAIDRWVLRQCCVQVRAWLDAGLPAVPVAVNISAMEFRNEKFLEGIFDILKETGLDPKLLELELTESVLMKRPAATESILNTLRSKGVKLSVDDFGTGYSSLSYLRKFSMDGLKIDQSFIRKMTTDPGEASIVTAMISMGRSLNLLVVAEGVETPQELAFLQERQCDEAQGFYFSRPVPPQQFASLLANGISEPVPSQV